ncbi:hypothetical protein HELRODRAFT_131725, partial [Helobdella robusta]|uniref:cyclin-dependent kinase n=1 Tax=Helobdella robusta TaxID=6412 RepID=T1EHW4_HELRO
KYVNLGSIGEGSYGLVLKCRDRLSGKLVAIKKFIESEDDKSVKKIAMREIHLLKQLRHENLVNLIEVFRRKKRLYLVFEFVDKTLLHYLEQSPRGLDRDFIKRILYQVIRALEFCHIHNIIHRDVKPENVLITKWGIVKLCDFGFARIIAKPGEAYTEYVATRWYRAPELLVGDSRYGRAVDIWALGCLHAEMLTGQPLFPGDSDLDQLFNILKCFGKLLHEDRLNNNSAFRFEITQIQVTQPLHAKVHGCNGLEYQFISACLELDPQDRPTCSHLLLHPLFTHDGFNDSFPDEMMEMMKND